MIAKKRSKPSVRGAGAPETTEEEPRNIWRELSNIGEAIPAEEWDRLPRDSAKNFDHYMGGAPKEDLGGAQGRWH